MPEASFMNSRGNIDSKTDPLLAKGNSLVMAVHLRDNASRKRKKNGAP